MLDFLFSLGQTVAALLLLYGAVLVVGQLLPARKPAGPQPQGEPLLMKHMHTDA